VPHATREQRRQYWLDYYRRRRAEHLARGRAYRKANSARLIERQAKRRAANPARYETYYRDYYYRNRTAILARRAARRSGEPSAAQPVEAPNVTAPCRASWTILAEVGEREGIEYARCRCAHGHIAVIAVDVRPPPDCTRCLRRRPGRQT
jgi:hypothetical protein